MKEVSQNELRLISKCQHLEFELQTEREYIVAKQRIFLLLAIFTYVVLTVMTTAIATSNKDQALVKQQRTEIIRQQQVITEQQIRLAEQEELGRLLSDLQKVEP